MPVPERRRCSCCRETASGKPLTFCGACAGTGYLPRGLACLEGLPDWLVRIYRELDGRGVPPARRDQLCQLLWLTERTDDSPVPVPAVLRRSPVTVLEWERGDRALQLHVRVAGLVTLRLWSESGRDEVRPCLRSQVQETRRALEWVLDGKEGML